MRSSLLVIRHIRFRRIRRSNHERAIPGGGPVPSDDSLGKVGPRPSHCLTDLVELRHRLGPRSRYLAAAS
jgi:hypothetical protein